MAASFTPGARLGPYEVEAKLGEGGMGEVYRARDTRLDRTVAIKVLLAGTTWSPDARARFEREARAISQLNHGNICTLFDVGREGDTDFIVLEYLAGETLATRLTRGALPVEEAVAIGIQMADALAVAHRRGIIHRDLKPGNVMLVRAGSAKSDAVTATLLEFGLAQALGAPTAATAGTEPTTVTSPMPLPGQGALLGTMLYMAPEQVEGQEADARSDLWALGCVLFEMITGRRTFDGKTHTNIAAAILEREAPALTSVAPHVPAALAHIVGRCLEKDRDARWQTASDVRRELQWVARQSAAPLAASSAATPAPAPRHWVRDPRSLAALTTAVLGLMLAARGFLVPGQPAGARDVVSLSITLPESLSDVQPPNTTWMNNVALSPDDVHVAFSGLRGGTRVLFLRRVDTFEVREMPGGGRYPFFSADGRALAFMRGNEIWRTPVDTLAPVRVGAMASAEWNILAALWHPRGDLLFAAERGVYRMPDAGGDMALVVKSDASTKQIFRELSLLPDGRLLASTTDTSGEHLLVIDASTWQATTLVGQTGGRFAGGWLFRLSRAGMVAVRFDERRLASIGEPIALGSVTGPDVNVLGVPAVSRGGSVAWFVIAIVPREPVFVDRTGREHALPFWPDQPMVRWPRLSPSGHRLAHAFSGDEDDPLRITDLRTGAVTQLPRVGATEPVWLLDESAIVSAAGTYPNHGLVRQPVDGRKFEPVGEVTDFEVWPASISKNGELAYYVGTSEGIEDLYVLDFKTKKVTRIPTPGTQRGARFSPDGRWIAYESALGGVSQIEVVSWPDLALRRVVSSDGGTEPIWSADQREIFYRNGDKVMAAKVLPGPDFASAPATELFSRPYLSDPFGDQSWDLAPDGRFLMLKAKQAVRPEVRMIRNVPALLEAAAGKR